MFPYRRGYDAAPMRKILTQSSMACESELHQYRAGSHDISASSSVVDPVTHSPQVLVRHSHRPTFGISLNELKAAIAPRAELFRNSPDETDRFTFCFTSSNSKTTFMLNFICIMQCNTGKRQNRLGLLMTKQD